MKKNLVIAFWFTLVTTVMFGILYPLAVTGLAQVLFPKRANGQLIEKNGKTVGSRIIGQILYWSLVIFIRGRPMPARDTMRLRAAARTSGPRTRTCSTE